MRALNTGGGSSMRRVVAGLGLACVVLAVACAREPRRPRKTDLARLPANAGPIAVADNGSSYAYRALHDQRVSIVHDGAAGPEYVAASGPTLSPVTRKLFYWAGHAMDRGFLVADGKTYGEDVGRESTLVFSKDGAHWATTASLHDRGPNDSIPGPVVVFADGRELGTYPDASLPDFSPDAKHVAYLAAGPDGAKLIVDGAERASYATPTADCAARAFRRPKRTLNPFYWPQFQVGYLSDGRLVVMTQDADGWGIYRDGVRLASYQASIEQARPYLKEACATSTAVAAWSLIAAEEAPVLAWWERMEGSEERWRMIVDGKPADDVVCSHPWPYQPAELTRDGRHIAYACAVSYPEERIFLVADGRRYGPYWSMWAYSWADDGSHVAYGAIEEPMGTGWQYFVDGEPRTDRVTYVWRPLLEPKTGRLVWQSREEGERAKLGIDRRAIAAFDDVVWGPRFLQPGTVTWVIRRGRRLVRLDVPIH